MTRTVYPTAINGKITRTSFLNRRADGAEMLSLVFESLLGSEGGSAQPAG